MKEEIDLDIAVNILSEFQEWRLGNTDEFPQTAKLLTKAINTILNYLKEEQ